MLRICLLILAFVEGLVSNLIQYGDFQGYPQYVQTYTSSSINFGYADFNYSLWYGINTAEFQIQIQDRPLDYTTYICDLSNNNPLTLCQNVNLSIGNRYRLTYSIYSDLFTNVKAKAFVNGNLLGQILILNPNNSKNQSFEFNAEQITNSICFNQTHDNQHLNPNYGAAIDNITLILAQRQQISFSISVNQFKDQILLQSQTLYSQEQAGNLLNTYIINIQGDQPYFEIIKSTNGNLQVTIYYDFTFNENNINFIQKSNANQTSYDICFNPPPNNKFYNKFQKYEILFLEKSKEFLAAFNEYLAKLSTFSRVFFVSYFLQSIVDAHYLSLFYIFIKPQVSLDFLKKFYHKILQIIFSRQGAVEYILNIFNISINIINVPFEDKMPEKIETEIDNQPWFGSYNISSKLLTNNICNLIVIVLIIIKYFLLKLILKLARVIVPQSIKNYFYIKTKIYSILLKQFCFMAPTMIISSLANILGDANNFTKKIYKGFCINFLFIIIICLITKIILSSLKPLKIKQKIETKKQQNNSIQKQKNKNQNKKDIISKNTQKKKVIFRKIKIQVIRYSDNAFIMLLILFIPFGAFFNDAKFFFVTNSITIFLRFVGFSNPKHSKLKIMLSMIEILAWTTHHISFILMWQFKRDNLSRDEFSFICKLGLVVLVTILIILVVSLLRLLISISKIVFQGVVFLYNQVKIFRGVSRIKIIDIAKQKKLVNIECTQQQNTYQLKNPKKEMKKQQNNGIKGLRLIIINKNKFQEKKSMFYQSKIKKVKY